jgi:hypothetical protein
MELGTNHMFPGSQKSRRVSSDIIWQELENRRPIRCLEETTERHHQAGPDVIYLKMLPIFHSCINSVYARLYVVRVRYLCSTVGNHELVCSSTLTDHRSCNITEQPDATKLRHHRDALPRIFYRKVLFHLFRRANCIHLLA